MRTTTAGVPRGLRRALLSLALAAIAAWLPAAAAAATGSVPHWLMISQAAPYYFHAGESDAFYEILAVNDGPASTSGEITLTDRLPEGLAVDAVVGYAENASYEDVSVEDIAPCAEATAGKVVTVTCHIATSVPTGRAVAVTIYVTVAPGAAGTLANTATISGGGAQADTVENSTLVTAPAAKAPYGAELAAELTNTAGEVDLQAGSHPFAFTTLLAFNVGSVNPQEHDCGALTEGEPPGCARVAGEPKDLEVILPAGLVGNPTAVARCTQRQFQTPGYDNCPPSSQVGGMYLRFSSGATHDQYAPVYNIEPPPGQPAELGFTVSALAHIPMFFHVRSDGDYGLTADLANISQLDVVRIAALSIWGVPADAAHDPLRLGTAREERDGEIVNEICGNGAGGCPSGVAPRPFLTLPSSCSSEPLPVTVTGDSWEEPRAAPFGALASQRLSPLTGCEALTLAPVIAAEPTTLQAGAPTGYDGRLDVPQHEAVAELATPDVRDAEVTLPAGTVVSPAVANGLLACSEAQFARTSGAPGDCPPQSKIGAVKITTPLLCTPLSGSLFVGQPECSPCSATQAQEGKLIHLFLEAAGAGVIVKLSGHTKLDQATGQLTAVFAEDPQLPFNALEVSLEAGPNAPLVNPSACGPVVATAALTPWSAASALEVTAPAVTISGCSAPGFSPTLEAGDTTSARAGAFTPFSVTLTRPDGQQALRSVSVSLPPGLLGRLANVPLCGAGDANGGTCPAASQIGSTTVTLGPGPQPLTVAGGKVFLTGPYEGKPFGLSVVVPAQAGPFELGGTTGAGTVVVRAAIAVDPRTAALTIASGELPNQLDGIPLDIRTVTIAVDREAFMFNPTNCDPLAVGGAMTSTSGATATASYPFQAVDCASLPFKPAFTVSTRGHASVRGNGASLTVEVRQKPGEADIGSVRVELPKKLPSRLATLQKACVQRVFVVNPASCPPGSVVGMAIARTPVLPVPLSGPAYFVSHGGAKFPELVSVLQGYGVTIELFGETKIGSRSGITTSNFGSVPDTPISSFELKLPERSNSALVSTGGDLCRTKLAMPTTITAQNGARLQQMTKIAVTGCSKRLEAKAKRVSSDDRGRSRPSRPRPRR
jgi:hypothetical protein